MRLNQTLLFTSLVLLQACGGDDITLSKVNTPPVAEILSPGDDAEPFPIGETITFDGLVNDGQDSTASLLATWMSNLDGTLSEEVPSDSGRVQFATNTLSEGSHVITLQVMDTSGELGEDYVTLQVTRSNDGPRVQIDYPANGAAFEEGDGVTFTASVSDDDAEDPPESLSIQWTSDLDGFLCNDAADGQGAVRCTASALSLGLHVVTVVAEDSMGETGSDQVVVEIEVPDEAPQVAIVTPQSGDVVLSTAIQFAAEVEDDQDRPDALLITWESDLDGIFNWDRANIDGGIAFTGGLSVGTHQVSLAATDSKSQSGEDSIRLVVLSGDDWDSDGDGYTPNQGDCDDTTTLARPGATEYCDGMDNDCDGTTDEGDAVDAIMWYQDADGDGYGNGGSTRSACTQPTGYVSNASDCDDGRATVNPSVAETCNGMDDDCDGTTDEDASTDVLTWYRDADSDGYGNASSTDVNCTQPAGYVADKTDCNDSSAAAHPGATEYCDGLDNDCDGSTDENSAADVYTWYRDADSDGYGVSTTTQAACAAPSGYVANATDCNDSSATIYPGAPETCNTADDDCDGSVNEGLGDSYETNDTYPGTSLGAMDGDGYCTYITGHISGSAASQTLSGTIHNLTDVDYYSFTTTDSWYDCLDESGYGIQVTLSGIPAGHDYTLALYRNSGGSLLASSDNSGSTSESVSYHGSYSFSSDSDDGGTYTIVVAPKSTSSFGCTAYTLSVTVW